MDTMTLVASVGLLAVLLALAVIDWRTLRLPNVLTLGLLVTGLIVTYLRQPMDIAGHAAAAAGGYLLLATFARSYQRLRGRAGLGLGDAKLYAAAGAWLGAAALPIVLFLAALSGLALVASLRLLGREVSATTPVPLGPAIALAFWTMWVYALWGGR